MRICPICSGQYDERTPVCPRDGTPLGEHDRSTRDPLIGVVIDGRYRIATPLGEGGMARVYLAHHARRGRTVAVKVLHPFIAQKERAVARFAQEARTATMIDHENVVAMLEFGHAPEGFHYLVMEHVPGVPLDVEIDRCAPFAAQRAAHILAQIAAGIAAGHKRGVIHRDVKPHNIMLTARQGDPDFVKILDFGLAKPFGDWSEATPKLTLPGQVFGTPEYMAPELCRGAPIDPRIDIYALGIVGYEMLTGSVPFRGHAVQIMTAHVQDPPERPSQRRADARIPALLEGIVMTCLEKDPLKRFQSVDELMERLGSVWSVIEPPTRNTTYARTRAAPPRLSHGSSAVPDPTVYQPTSMDIIWDGPALCDEIAHLHALRSKHLAELADALWGTSPPPPVEEMLRAIGSLEHAIESRGQQLALLTAQLDETDARARGEEAELRAATMDASFARGVAKRLLPPEVTTTIALEDPDRMLLRAERKLEMHKAKHERQRLALEAELAEHLSAVRAHETELMPMYERLSRIVAQQAGRRSDVRPLLIAFGKIDGALASYQALMEMMGD